MNLQKIYPSLLTANLAAAEGWYTKLLGRVPNYRTMNTLLHWEFFDHGGLMLSNSDEIASRGQLFLYVENVAAERHRFPQRSGRQTSRLGIVRADVDAVGHSLWLELSFLPERKIVYTGA